MELLLFLALLRSLLLSVLQLYLLQIQLLQGVLELLLECIDLGLLDTDGLLLLLPIRNTGYESDRHLLLHDYRSDVVRFLLVFLVVLKVVLVVFIGIIFNLFWFLRDYFPSIVGEEIFILGRV